MAGTYSYALFVALEGNPNVPKLKTKLTKYFQSKKSNGGDCLVECESSTGPGAVLRFRTEEDRQKVLGKLNHEISLDQGVFKLTVRLPSDEATGGKQTPAAVSAAKSGKTPTVSVPKKTAESGDGYSPLAEEELRSTSAVLENIPEDMAQNFLEMLVENILQSCAPAAQDFSLEMLPDAGMAVVVFQTGEVTENFISNCPKNKNFNKKKLSVKSLGVTTKVMVENIPSELDSDYLELYFTNKGDVVEDVVISKEDQSAIITFQDPKAVHRVIENQQIDKQPVKAYPFYESLGTALYGKERPTLRLPAGFSESIGQAIWRFLREKQGAAEIIHKAMAEHFCKVDLQQPAVQLSPLPSLLQQKGVKAKDIKEWKDSAKAAFTQALSAFSSLELHVQTTAWEETEREIKSAVSGQAVVIVPEEATGVIAVVGSVHDVNKLSQSLTDIIERMSRGIEREKTSITEEIPLLPSVYHILLHDGLQDKITGEFPELSMTYNSRSQSMIIRGLRQEVLSANRLLLKGERALKWRKVGLDTFVIEFLQKEDQEKLTSSLLTLQGINAALEINSKAVQLLAVSEEVLSEAEDQLNRLLISLYIDVEDCNVLKMPEWKTQITHLEETINNPLKKFMIQTSGAYPSLRVVVSGYKETVDSVQTTLDGFLCQNAPNTEILEVRSEAIVKFIEEHKKSRWSDEVRDVVKVSFKKEAISLSGARVHVTQCKTLFADLVSSTHFDTLKVSKPGAKKFFQDKKAMYIGTVMNQTGCVVQLVEEDNDGEHFVLVGEPTPAYQFQTPDGVEIVVCKADICDYAVQAVVNAANTDLKHSGGLARALLDAAGPQLQAESDQLVTKRGLLKPGDCVITGAGGQLRCKHIIHAVGPRFDPADPQRAVAQLRRAVKRSLDLAEKHSCLSVALPAISSGNYEFPLTLCAETIVKAVKDYCDDRYSDNSLKKIHLVNDDDKVVQAMEDAARMVFGGRQKHSSPASSTQAQPGPGVQRLSGYDKVKSKESLTMQTKEKLTVSVIKGNIQDAWTEAVVNTVGEDLNLSCGAVSKAILTAAGPRLQILVNQKATSVGEGAVIVTDGCNLNSKLVFHTIAPYWQNGQGAAEKVLSGIMKECLGQAEQKGLVSMTFPAIGTGTLGFPKPLVASLMLEAVLKFSKKHSKHLKEVVFIIHPGDQQTVQAFTDEFNKRFTNRGTTSGGSTAASTQQRTGPFSKVTTSSSGWHQTRMGAVAIHVGKGDLTKETTDVIVNSSNKDFSLKSGVSKAILDAAGQAVEAECQQLGAQPNPGMILTQPGNLQCKKILHLVVQSDPKRIYQAVKDALLLCAKNNYSSIAFPALGTGQANVEVSQVADAMLDAVVDVVSQNLQNTVEVVQIIVFQPAMLKEFHSSLVKKQGADQADSQEEKADSNPEKKSLWENIISFMGGGSNSEPQKDIVIEAKEVEPACFHICGDSQSRVADAKRWISDLILKEQVINSITDDAILSLTDTDHKQIDHMQRAMGVSVRLDKSPQPVLIIEGLSKDVLMAISEIQKMLLRIRDEKAFERNVEVTGNMVAWKYQSQADGPFLSFDPVANFLLEEAWRGKQDQVSVTSQGQVYKVSLPDGPAMDHYDNRFKIKRINLTAQDSLPQHWDPMPPKTSWVSCLLQSDSPEHIDVLTLFQATCNKTVLKIERIQNPDMWKGLEIRKQGMEVKNGHQNNEKQLFHGTCYTAVDQINENGFNRSYAGKNAAIYGDGNYFALKASYSALPIYSKPDPQGHRFMYLCRVLTGNFTQGQQDMKAPPAISPASPSHLYDSLTDDPANPSMFIVFHDVQAYPEYLITFKEP